MQTNPINILKRSTHGYIIHHTGKYRLRWRSVASLLCWRLLLALAMSWKLLCLPTACPVLWIQPQRNTLPVQHCALLPTRMSSVSFLFHVCSGQMIECHCRRLQVCRSSWPWVYSSESVLSKALDHASLCAGQAETSKGEFCLNTECRIG